MLSVLLRPSCRSSSTLACRECAFCMSRSIVVRFGRVTDGTGALKMFGNTGAPACAGERLMLIWRKLATSVVFPAERTALATARSGTRSKNNPALPRTTVFVESEGDHATPNRGETLLVSV